MFIIRTLFSLALITVVGCTSEKSVLETNLLEAAARSDSQKVTLDLSKLITAPIEKICIGGAYLLPDGLEKIAHRKISQEAMADKGEFVFWVFLANNKSIYLQLKSTKQLSYQSNLENTCTDSSILTIENHLIGFSETSK
ncbi:hypothetical protein [Methyloradius palustris]|uniref:Lipoprotein n=1 Tax=Methyloradius palustris TaxID=2778876 RepID=A0A8D5G1A4_9PROT|nr:hypothetical protein [Methyloradius palustris]BCM23820.1 hypothetical protein ZMTM_00790 [Methyloradius palustris]